MFRFFYFLDSNDLVFAAEKVVVEKVVSYEWIKEWFGHSKIFYENLNWSPANQQKQIEQKIKNQFCDMLNRIAR